MYSVSHTVLGTLKILTFVSFSVTILWSGTVIISPFSRGGNRGKEKLSALQI